MRDHHTHGPTARSDVGNEAPAAAPVAGTHEAGTGEVRGGCPMESDHRPENPEENDRRDDLDSGQRPTPSVTPPPEHPRFEFPQPVRPPTTAISPPPPRGVPMNQPEWIIHPTIDEIEDVRRFASISYPEETDATGVWVTYDGMERVWTGSSRNLTWEVRGGMSIEPQRAQHLPSRVLYEAGCIARDEGLEIVTLLVPTGGGVVIVQSPRTETVIDLHDDPMNPSRSTTGPDRASAARALVEAGALADLLSRASATPVGGPSEALPEPILTIGDGMIGIHVDWSIRGARRTTYRCEAVTDGEARCIVPVRLLHDTMGGADPDMIVELDIPVDPFGSIVMREPGARSTLPCRPADARRHSDAVLDVLIELFAEHTEVIDAGSYGFELDDRPYTVQLLDAPDAIVRVASTVCDLFQRHEPGLELLRHLNEVNAGLVAGRLWTDGRRVWAAIDLPVSDLASIPWAIEKLRTQLDGFHVFLGAIVSETTT